MKAVTLRSVVERVSLMSLTPSAVAAVLNNSSASHSVPEHTKRRIVKAARELNYRPNFFARSLRVRRTYTIGVILERSATPRLDRDQRH
jgi:DNA-binding LacI/PurR family transcriptional regulator